MHFKIWKETSFCPCWITHNICCCDNNRGFCRRWIHSRRFKGALQVHEQGRLLSLLLDSGWWILLIIECGDQLVPFWLIYLVNFLKNYGKNSSRPEQHNSSNAIFCLWMIWKHLGIFSSFPGFHSFYLIRIGWEEKYTMVILKGMLLKLSCMMKVSDKVVLGVSSFLIKPMCEWMESRLVWAMSKSNFIMFACVAITAIISLISVKEYSQGIKHVIGGRASIRVAVLVVFTLLGFPLAITYSVPFSVTAELTADSGGGQGLAIGGLNLAIVISQMIVSLGASPWDDLFGGKNIPASILASFSALAVGIIATLRLPYLSSSFKSSGFHIS